MQGADCDDGQNNAGVVGLSRDQETPEGCEGSKQISARFGDDLVCVRHLVDPTGTRRVTTVELVVAEAAIQRKPSPLVDVLSPTGI